MEQKKRKRRPAKGSLRKLSIKQLRQTVIYALALVGLISIIVFVVRAVASLTSGHKAQADQTTEAAVTPQTAEPDIDVELLTVNNYSRPGLALNHVNGIVVHYTANPGTTAMQNRDYFEGLKDSHTTHASSHFIIGLDGEIVQCIPTSEEAYASNTRNSDTVSIECCHPDKSGQFNDATYQSLIQLTAFLCGKFNLDPNTDVIRHYDITGKNCPKYYVEHQEAWDQFITDLADYIKKNGTEGNE